MITTTTIIILLLGTILGIVIGYLIHYFRQLPTMTLLQQKITQLSTTLQLEQQNAVDKQTAVDDARKQLSETFKLISTEALEKNNNTFLQLARENLKQFQLQAENEFTKKEKNIEHLIKPIKQALEKTEKQIHEMEKDRKEAYGSLHKHLETMAVSQQTLQSETRNLVNALRKPEVRGQWGEMTLKRLAELAGMVNYCDFFEQQQINTDEGSLRPDMIVRIPAGREIIVDAKTPLTAYLNAIECTDESSREQELIRHSRHVRERIKELASKSYWSQFKNAPDFIVLFIPGDQFLAAALDKDHTLLEHALQQNVILATPTSFVALLRAVAYGWRQEQLTQNAQVIKEIGESLFSRLVTFTEHLNKVGRSLDNSVKNFNNAVGSFDSRILPSVRKFSDLGINTGKTPENIKQIETGLRSVEQLDENE